MPFLVVIAILISTLFGYSFDQFLLSIPEDQSLHGIGFLAIGLITFLSCSLEEVGWRGYGIDSLLSKYNLFITSLIFAILWSFWHVPAFFIKDGYFQQEVLNLGLIYVAVYFASLFPITYLINWIYIKNNRSILAAIIFHSMMNLSYGLLRIEPFTKIIVMILLFLVSSIVVFCNKKVFFQKF